VRGRAIALVALAALASAGAARADVFAEYGSGTNLEVELPTITGGFVEVIDQFPETADVRIGSFPVDGLVLAAQNRTVYLQNAHASSGFVPVATVTQVMDPAFVRISPNGQRVALGLGFGQHVLVFPTSLLSAASPPNLATSPSVAHFAVNHSDAEWLDDTRLLVNGGSFPGPPFTSGLSVINTLVPGSTGTFLISIPGGSGAIAVDHGGTGAVVTGIGFLAGPPNRTGELKIWRRSDIDAAIAGGTTLSYDANPRLLAQNVLSAIQLGFDVDGNLHVGGGDAFGPSGVSALGYAALIHHNVVSRVLAPTPGAPVAEGNALEYRELAPDPCENDSSTMADAGLWGSSLAVGWNPNGPVCGAPGTDSWGPGVTPILAVYVPASAPDDDLDGVPDAADNAWLTANPGQQDADGDGYANAADADFDQTGFVDLRDFWQLRQAWQTTVPASDDRDMSSNGAIEAADLALFKTRWLKPAPWF
jgi:hypothetical protein